MRLAFFGGIYSNWLALEAAVRDAVRRGVDRMYCLGDLGAFGPFPDRVFPILHEHAIECVQGNYDDSVGNALNDCQCGYTDPNDNRFAQISYDYTLQNTSEANRQWLRTLPCEIRFEVDGLRFLLCHGSPRRTNEFLWESACSTHFLARLVEAARADVVVGTHSGIHWHRALSDGRHYINAGVLGRPENDGRTNVWYCMVATRNNRHEQGRAAEQGGAAIDIEFVRLEYDYRRLAAEMRSEKLPDEFVATILHGWWTTCLEVLPARERKRGRY